MSHQTTENSDWAANTAKNTLQLGLWTAAWVVTMAVANFGPKFIWNAYEPLTILAIIMNILVGFGMILANKKHLNGLDELQQKIQLEAMALSLGIGLVAGLGYSNLDVTNVIAFDAEISHLVILMTLCYAAGIFLGVRKYR
jgi:cytochrome c biogenesis protein CcdA